MNTGNISSETGSLIVTCLGSSTTAAKGSFNWIAELAKRPQNKKYRFYNLGVGGDLSYNALRRVLDVVALRPDIVIVIIGANDILAKVFPKVKRVFSFWKRLPQEPSPAWFRENLQKLVRQLKKESNAHVALTSLAQVGESPDSGNPIQKELNESFGQFCEIIKEVAAQENTGYIPFYERMHEQILVEPGRPFIAFNFLPFYRDAFGEFILRRSVDEVANMNGWKFHVDGVHLNTRGGMILTELVQKFLDGACVNNDHK